MPRERLLLTTTARLVRPFFWALASRVFTPPKRAVILQPCCLSRAMLTTPLAAILNRAYPDMQLDWAISETARAAISKNPRITELIDAGFTTVSAASWGALDDLAQRLHQQDYGACFIPSASPLLSWVAWRAGIPQRIGLGDAGRGFANTRNAPPPASRHAADRGLAIAVDLGLLNGQLTRLPMEFYPSDGDRTAVTQRLIDELDWLGDRPLVVMHPGGGAQSVVHPERHRWPIERFVLLGNEIVRTYGAQLLLVGGHEDTPLTQEIDGLTTARVGNWSGRISLNELGALAEVADLYIGNDTGPTHVAAAMGCPTIAIFCDSDPAISAPYHADARIVILQDKTGDGVTVAETAVAVKKLLNER